MGGQVHSDDSWLFMETFQGEKKKSLYNFSLSLLHICKQQTPLEGKEAVLN